MSIDTIADTLIHIQWINRTTENDSITVERKVDDGDFEFFTKIAYDATEFVDSTAISGSAYYYRLKTTLGDTLEIQSYPIMMDLNPSFLPEEGLAQVRLSNNYPDPFSDVTTFNFALPSRSFVTLKIFDALGRELETLISEELDNGEHTRVWNAKGLSSGIYFYRIQVGDFAETKRLTILR
jgi:hypothetical protein